MPHHSVQNCHLFQTLAEGDINILTFLIKSEKEIYIKLEYIVMGTLKSGKN